MLKKWTSPVYVFFKPTPEIKYKDSRRCHVFECAAGSCKGKNTGYVSRFLDKGDANSTGNLLCHARICWGTDVVAAATATKDIHTARDVLAKTKFRDGSILAEFQRAGKGKISYRHTQHTTAEARYVPLITFVILTFRCSQSRAEIVRWVSESKRPFKIVNDRGFQSLMKTGRLGYHIPSPSTVSRDVKQVFKHVRQWIARMLQVGPIRFVLL
jgi:hypothetical protein